MRFSLLLFDLDGTLVDSHGEICLALEQAVRELDLPLSRARVEQLVDGSPLELIWTTILAQDLQGARPYREDDYLRFARAYRAHYMRDLGHATACFPEVRATLLRIKEHAPQTQLAVVSNKAEPSVAPLLERCGLADLFQLALGCGSSQLAPKPAPDLLLKAAHTLGHSVERCAMIGDTTLDVLAGKRAGMTTFALSHGMGDREALRAAGADYLVHDFVALERALLSA